MSGIHQGWHALTRTALAIGHGLGVVLPLGTVGLLLAALLLWFVRRFTPVLALPAGGGGGAGRDLARRTAVLYDE